MSNKSIRITCPPLGLTKEERVQILFENIEKWVRSDALKNLIQAFGGEIPKDQSLKDYIDWLNDFVNVWDYRKKQAQGGERWEIDDDKQVSGNVELIKKSAEELGLIDIYEPIERPDYILPLGGARLSNLVRCQYSKVMADLFKGNDLAVVALSGKRPINEIELPFLQEYAPDAQTEFDAINKGLEISYNLDSEEYSEKSNDTGNINLQWAIREYQEKYLDKKIMSLAAPSTDPDRRANSFDTFEFFMEKFSIKPGDRMLLVTSPIYVPFQLLKFMSISLENDICVDCVGAKTAEEGSQFSKSSNYLQETKGTVNAIKTLADRYL